MKTCLRGVALAVAFLLFVVIGLAYGTRLLDRTVAVLILALYVVGSAVLVFKALGSRPEDWPSIFSCGVLAPLPGSWRRWLLDEENPAARH